ncbi:hypothetical protein D3C72_2514070 [compost metagenome]
MPNCWAMLILPSAWAKGLSSAVAARETNKVSAERLKAMVGNLTVKWRRLKITTLKL